ncbi:hypothetical protein AB7M18_003967 [Pseudomonas viridiflava]
MDHNSTEFTLAVLREMPYFDRLSTHLRTQVAELSITRLAFFKRALDAFEGGSPITKSPGAFNAKGILAGYGHLHFKREDWVAGNFAAQNRKPPAQPLEVTLAQEAESLLKKGKGYEGVLERVERFSKRASSNATGDWVLFRNGKRGIEYLAIHEHTDPGSEKELQLKWLLDGLSV